MNEGAKHAPHTFVGVVPEDVADGRMVSRGKVVEIDPADPHNAAMIERGVLIPTPTKKATPAPASPPEEKGAEGGDKAAGTKRGAKNTSEEGSK